MEERVCSVKGCSNIAKRKGWCSKHYYRFYEHGHFLNTRPHDWGSREKNPLYSIYHGICRSYSAKGKISKEWVNDFWKFVADVKGRPSKEHRLYRKDDTKPFGKNNFYWKLIKRGDETRKEYCRQWQREARKNDPEFVWKTKLRQYGLNIEQYSKMHKEQSGVCAICGCEEKSFEYRTGKVRSLSVDHCHSTGKVRGLLCSHCNRGLGSFKDSTELLSSAIRYLSVI